MPFFAQLRARVSQSPGALLFADKTQLRLCLNPLEVLIAHTPADVLAVLERLEQARQAGRTIAGFMTYEAGMAFEPHAAAHPLPAGEPLAWFGIYADSQVFPYDPLQDTAHPAITDFSVAARLESSEEHYQNAIQQIQDWIGAGEIYQLNYTMPLAVQTTMPPGDLFAHLFERQPVDYAAWLNLDGKRHIVSLSPELFFRIDSTAQGQRICTRPMKGTVQRGRTTVEDLAQASWLHQDEKNRAENVMIVDLLRNDLGRLCQFGSVRVEELFHVERYPTLWQMTSTITGELRPEAGLQAIFRALFPCGSITGAPKVSAMQRIARVEDIPRGVYTGAVGFATPETAVFSVAIRTLELHRSSAGYSGQMGVGSGIVADSQAHEEWQECALKTQFLTDNSLNVNNFELLESLLWNDGYPRLSLHLDRLLDSADYFGFCVDRLAAQRALEELATGLNGPHKVRLTADRSGHFTLNAEPIHLAASEPVRLMIAVERVPVQDVFHFHKTTHRMLYQSALAAAQAAGMDDAVLLNTHGEVTETTIANLFIVKDGRWTTPPVACALLAGVERRHLLATRPDIRVAPLRLADLASADEIWISNAVRGLRRAVFG